jgi:hypothetical protein
MHIPWYLWVGGGVIMVAALYLLALASLGIWALKDKENT